MELVTGYAGKAHITAVQNGALNAGIVGSGSYVFNTGEKLSASVVTNNLIRIMDGDLIANGRHITIAKGTYEEVEIANGLQGVKRNDLICARYEKNADSGIESASLVVIQGTSTQGTPVDPEYNDNSILDGTLISDFPLYRITLDGLNVGEPKKLFTVIKNINDIQGDINALNSNLNTKISGLRTSYTKRLQNIENSDSEWTVPKNGVLRLLARANSDDATMYIKSTNYFSGNIYMHDFHSKDEYVMNDVIVSTGQKLLIHSSGLSYFNINFIEFI